MRILVTGGAGFIGSHLIRHLKKQGHTVLGLDRRPSNITRDVCLPIWMDNLDQIYHLACPASPIEYQKDPLDTIRTCLIGTSNVLDTAYRCHARMLLASTSEVYGNPAIHPQVEEYWGHVNPIGPRSCYDEGKRAAEALVMAYHTQRGLETRIARIFNTYGPGMRSDDGRVVSNFIVHALKDRPLHVYGTGAQTRSFCYVDDMVRGLVALMNSGVSEPINLGNPDERTILEIAELVKRLANSHSKIIFKPLPIDDPVRRCPDITKAKHLNWEPTVSLETGLLKTIEYFRRENA